MNATSSIRPVPRGSAAMTTPMLVGALLGSLVVGRIETGALCLLVAGGAAALVGAHPPSRVWIASMAISAAFAWALNLYLTPGRALAGLPLLLGRAPTSEGLQLGALLTLRVAGAFVSLQGLRASWNAEQAADAAARVLKPLARLRIPVSETRMMVGLALRFAPLLRTEAVRIARVQELRAGRPSHGPREWLQRRRAALVPTLVGALERAERVALALEARHYPLRPPDDVPQSQGRAGLPWQMAAAALAGTALLWRG